MTTSSKELFSGALKVISIHFSLFLFLTAFVYFFINGDLTFTTSQLIQWDSGWYQAIKQNGYTFIENSQNSTGFFPLFPFVWYITGLGTIGISLLNFFLFVVSFCLLVQTFQPKEKTQYLFLSIPGLFFFIIPYTESLFFLFSTLLLIGLKKDNWILTAVAFLLATLTRSAGTIFIPALIVSVYFLSDSSSVKKTFARYLLYILVCIGATLLVVYIQYLQTGVWFAVAKTHKYWDHYLRFPEFPLRSWGRAEILRLDGSGMVVGIIASFLLLSLFLSKIKKQYREQSNYYLFSLLYLCGIVLSMLVFQGGLVVSLNRYIFATPFYLIFLLSFENRSFPTRHAFVGFFLLTLYWLAFGSYAHISILLGYLLLSVFLASFLLLNNPSQKIARTSFVLIYLLSTLAQAYFFALFLKGVWIG